MQSWWLPRFFVWSRQVLLKYFPNTQAVNIVGMTDKASVEVAKYLKNNLYQFYKFISKDLVIFYSISSE